jgi:N-acetylglucosamine-6-sulfatase
VRTRLSIVIGLISVMVGAALLPNLAPEEDSQRLNVLVIVTDDQSADSIPRTTPVMPYLQERALDPEDHWVVFENAFVNTPVCCPSRATLLTGGYAHHTGVQDNRDGSLIDERATLAVWLHGAGYHTGLVGKYLNGYPFDRGPYVPEAWERWWGKVQGPPESLYHDFTLVEQGVPVAYGHDESDYSTDVYAEKALQFIREAPLDRPFFLWLAPTAPHPPWASASRHQGRYRDLPVPTLPSTGEIDVSDKPAWVRALDPFDADDLSSARAARRASYEALLAVDDAVRRIMAALRDRDELGETLIVYLSDNGFSFGEHRWMLKTCPYEECIRVPFLVRLPGVEHRVERAMVSGVDLAPTIAELVGVDYAGFRDGASLVPLLLGGSRVDLPGEVFAEWVGDERIPPWWELRTPRWAYVELATGERELYDLEVDPYQLTNVVGDPSYAGRVGRLSSSLAAYRNA